MRRPKGFTPPKPPKAAGVDWEQIFSNMGQDHSAWGAGPAEGGKLQQTADFGANPGELMMFSHIPENLPPGAPLVVILHGCGQSAAAYDRGAGWSTLADRYGFAVLAPEQNRTRHINGCFNWFLAGDTTRGGGEVASIRQMIAHAVAEHRLDPRRIYVTGLSAGGGMTSALLAAYPEVFAGGAIIAGLPYGAAGSVQEALGTMRQPPERSRRQWGDAVRGASSHKGPWPKISVWHGDADYTVGVANAEAIVDQWCDVHGLSAKPTYQHTVNGYPRQVWRDADGAEVIESYTLTGMGHGTPIHPGEGGVQCGAVGPFILQAGISSSYEIAKFWGLTSAMADNAGLTPITYTPPPPEAEPRPAPLPPHAWAALPSAEGPQEVIERALRAAGLLK